jgi:hypothetical protein
MGQHYGYDTHEHPKQDRYLKAAISYQNRDAGFFLGHIFSEIISEK